MSWMRHKADALEEKFRRRNKRPGSVLILEPADALTLLEEAEENGLRLLGFDGFFLPDDIHIQPSMADSWDYSSGPGARVKTPFEHARAFIRERSDTELYFEIVLADPVSSL